MTTYWVIISNKKNVMDTQTKKRVVGITVIVLAVLIGIRLLPLMLNLLFILLVAGAAYFGYNWLKRGK